MRFIVYLLTLFMVGTAVAQNPTILQGNYITNVFGQSNFIKNPNAQTNTASVTTSSATVTRSTTTPLVATSEFNITTSTSTGYAEWTTRTFDAGMKNQNCEARFTYRGFAVATTTAQIVQGSNTVAQLVLTPSTDPRIASINFPCGDLSNATVFRIQQGTANLTGTNEIGGIYLGLATNQANVAQAEEVGSYTVAGATNCLWDRTGAGSSGWDNFSADSDCGTGSITGAATTSAGKIPGATFSNLKPGKYMFVATYSGIKLGGTADEVLFRLGDGTTFSTLNRLYVNSTSNFYMPSSSTLFVEYTTTSSPTIRMQGLTATTTNTVAIQNSNGNDVFKLVAYRFPTSSELVVTPERQNMFAAAKWTGGSVTNHTSTSFTAAGSGFTGYTPYGKASTTTPSNYEITIDNLRPGLYRVEANALFWANSTGTVCEWGISDDGGTTVKYGGSHVETTSPTVEYQGTNQVIAFFNYTSVQSSKTFRVYGKRVAGTSNCQTYPNYSEAYLSMIPLDQPSNSALYVQGPVKAAATGATIAAGYVGETIEASGSVNRTSGTATNFADVTGMSVTVTPGVWLICAYGTSYFYNAGSGFVGFEHRIYNSTDATQFANQYQRGRGYGNDDSASFTMCKMFKATASKTFVTQTKVRIDAGVYTYGSQYAEGTISAIRLN